MIRLRLELAELLLLTPLRAGPAFEYIPRKPEETVLYGVIVEQLQAFLARSQARERPIPRFLEREFRDYLTCGVAEHPPCRICLMCWLDSPSENEAFGRRIKYQRDRFYRAFTMAAPRSRVVAFPPRSGVRGASGNCSTVSIARNTAFPASASPRCSSISAADQI